MLAPVDSIKLRRRPATYSKAQRSGLLDRDSMSTGIISDHLNGVGWLTCDGNGPGASYCRLMEVNRCLTPDKERSTPGQQHNKSAEKSPAISTASRMLSNAGVSCDDTIYDVPSSDDEVIFAANEHGSATKRRRLHIPTKKNVEGAVYDDDSLQRHIAAEIAEYPYGTSACAERQRFCTIVTEDLFSKSCDTSRNTGRKISNMFGHTQPEGARGIAHSTVSTISRPNTRFRGYAYTENVLARKAGLDLTPKHTSRISEQHPVRKSTRSEQVSEAQKAPHALAHSILERNTAAPSTHHTESPVAPNQSSRSILNISQVNPEVYKSQQLESHSVVARDGSSDSSPSRQNILSVYSTPCGGLAADTASRNDQVKKNTGQPAPIAKALRTRLVDKLQPASSSRALRRYLKNEERINDDSTGCYDSDSRTSSIEKGSFRESPISRDTQGLEKRLQNTARLSSSQLAPNGTLKATYTARHRSYLTEEYAVEAASFSVSFDSELETKDTTRRRGTIGDPPRLPIFQGDLKDAIETEDSQTGVIRSIYELREAGGNARLIGEMEDILDDLDVDSITAIASKRSALLDLASKLQQPPFYRQFMDQGLETRLLAQVGRESDMIVDMLLIIALLIMVKGPCSARVLSQLTEPRLIEFFGRQLENDQDLITMAKQRKSSTSRTTQMDIEEFSHALLQAPMWSAGKPPRLSARVLTLQYLEYLVRHVREVGLATDFLTQTIVDMLVDTVGSHHLLTVTHPKSSSGVETHLAASILESITISNPLHYKDQEILWSRASIDKLTQLLPLVENCSDEGVGILRALALRLCLNLTTNNPVLSESLSNPEVIGACVSIIKSHFHFLSSQGVSDEQALILDNLILSLGLLVNLAEWSEPARQLFGITGGQTAFLDALLQIFLIRSNRAPEVTLTSNYLYPTSLILTGAHRA